jgi:thioredoxin 1
MSSKSNKKPHKSRFKVKRAVVQHGNVGELRNPSQFTQLVENSDKPAIIDFWAEWCMPCKATAPAYAAAADKLADKVNFFKVNTELSPTLAKQFGIRSIPTLITLYRGEVVDVHIGASNQAGIERMAEKVLKHAQRKQGKASVSSAVDAESTATADGHVAAPAANRDSSQGPTPGVLSRIRSMFAA